MHGPHMNGLRRRASSDKNVIFLGVAVREPRIETASQQFVPHQSRAPGLPEGATCASFWLALNSRKRTGISCGIRPSLDSYRSSARVAPILVRLPAAMRRARRRIAQRLPRGAPFVRGNVPAGAPATLVGGSGFGFVLRMPALTSFRVSDRVTLSRKSADLQKSRDQIDPSVDIDCAAGDPLRQRRREIGAGEADVHDVDKLAYRRPLLGLVQQQLEILQPRSRARL